MPRTLLPSLVFPLLLLAAPALAGEAPPPGSPEAEEEPGYLDVLGGTAVALDGELPEGIDQATFLWSIVEGEGGELFNGDRPSAVFLAPHVQKGMKRFVIELNVSYPDRPGSSRRIVIRVLAPDFAQETEEEEDPTAWLKERYRRIAEEEARKQESAPQVVVPGGGGGSSVSVGVGVGAGGWRGGSVGVRFSLSHPIEQPVDVPPPGQTHAPGEGTWDLPYPVPYQDLRMTFPDSVAERYAPPPGMPAESEDRAESEAEKNSGDDAP